MGGFLDCLSRNLHRLCLSAGAHFNNARLPLCACSCHLVQMSWMECQDGGDPAVAVSPRDIVYVLGEGVVCCLSGACQVLLYAASLPMRAPCFPCNAHLMHHKLPRMPFVCAEADAAASGAAPRAIAGTDTRCRGVSWGTGQFALLYEAEWKTRRSITWVRVVDRRAGRTEQGSCSAS